MAQTYIMKISKWFNKIDAENDNLWLKWKVIIYGQYF